MKKVKNSGTSATEGTASESTSTVNITEKKLGRPVKAGSARQIRLAERAAKAIGGVYVPLGRSIEPNSKRQIKLKQIAAAKASGAEVKKGRPVMTEEAKAEARAAREVLKNQALALVNAGN